MEKVKGFTLIELIIVIIILGILAAFAIPKYVSLDTEARKAVISGMAGSISAAAEAAHAAAVAQGVAAGGTITVAGKTIQLTNHYPDSNKALAASPGGIAELLNYNTNQITYTQGAASATFSYTGRAADCLVTYTLPVNDGEPAVVTSTDTGC